jgi:thioredoxin-like negative regulator of GroEL
MKKTVQQKKPVPAPQEPAPKAATEPIPDTTPFFKAVDWGAFWTAFIVTLIVYAWTLAPTVTLEDSGELAVGGDHLGVPHPPGYPIWTIIVWLFTKLFFFVQFRGQPNPAWSIGFASAFFGAFASGLTAILICRSGRDMLRSIKRTTELIGEQAESLICWAGGVAASLAFAFSPVTWSQAVIVEVYSLNAFFLVMVLFLTYVWMRRPTERLTGITGFVLGMALFCLGVMISRVYLHLIKFDDFWQVGVYYVLGISLIVAMTAVMGWIWKRQPNDRLLYLIALTFGLGLTNYQVLLLLLASLAIVILVRDTALFRDFALAAIPFALYYVAASSGLIQQLVGPDVRVSVMGIIHPTHPTTFLYIIFNFAVLGLAYTFLPNGKRVAPAILCLELGLLVYAFMPLASEMNPPINWGFPRTWEGFVHALTRGQYEKIVPTNIFSVQFVHQLGGYMTDLRAKFTLPIAILGLLPFAVWSVRIGQTRFRAIYAAVALAVLAVGFIMIEEVLVPTGTEVALLSGAYRLVIFSIMILMGIGAFIYLINQTSDLVDRAFGNARTPITERLTVGLVLIASAGLLLVIVFKILTSIGNPELHLTSNEKVGTVLAVIIPAILAGIVTHLIRGPAKLDLDIDREDQKWVIATLAGFIVMSVVLIALANPKGDIQDEFIQRVKFISSHALFAFWIGYGLIMALAAVDTLMQGRRWIIWSGALLAAIIIPAIPIHENYYNKELIRTDGGSEQNGHDFGWQFGNYGMRGANAINEELSNDEEPLPNPQYPPEMGPRAVFFGGTDPGRFVPTYMIYSADVRPDVYLITQNALADNTYMSVMRDLMGDEIWIPSVLDGNGAFQKYVEDVRTGRTPASADIKIEGGRVSVQGVGGVMLINGILAQMIFEHNKAQRDFYVEESYVIQWMYPYLTPHGLMMKINAEPMPNLPPDIVADDLDFWDWYTRRFVSNVKFLRDVCARKSFSKLRSAIAGVYTVRGMFNEAETAFKEALLLYPLSPEANFRLADLYMRWNKTPEAIRVMEIFCEQDPGNDRARGFVEEMKHRSTLNAKRQDLEAKLAAGKGNVGLALELADIYRQLGQGQQFQQLIKNLLGQKGLPGQAYLRMAQMSAEERNPEMMENALTLYTEVAPTDMRGWLDLAAVRVAMRRNDAALTAVQQAVRVGKEAAVTVLREDARFESLRPLPQFQRAVGGF